MSGWKHNHCHYPLMKVTLLLPHSAFPNSPLFTLQSPPSSPAAHLAGIHKHHPTIHPIIHRVFFCLFSPNHRTEGNGKVTGLLWTEKKKIRLQEWYFKQNHLNKIISKYSFHLRTQNSKYHWSPTTPGNMQTHPTKQYSSWYKSGTISPNLLISTRCAELPAVLKERKITQFTT